MVTEAVLNIVFSTIYSLLDKALSPIYIPSLSDDVINNLYEYLNLFDYAAQFIGFFIPMSVFKSCLTAVFLLFLTEHLYPVVLWFIKKIPFSIE